jgi:hypothetical protein
MFDLDEMKQQWADHDRKLEESIRLNWQLMRATHLQGARSAAERLTVVLRLELLAWVAIVIALGSFIHQYIALPRLAFPGAALDLFAIGMLAATVRQMVAIRQIEYGLPVTAVQRQFEMVRVLRIRTTQWGMLAGAVVWAPFVIVMLKVLFGIDNYSAAWLWTNILFGLLLIPAAIWISRKFGKRMGEYPFVQRLFNDIAGSNLNAARVFLATLSEFENEKTIV